ncbi:MAG: IS3 family transposase [Flavobacteriales bacterium]|nr:IS3 family transposase [Flavobacteriales bacterium]
MPLDVRRTLVDRELATKPGDQGGLSISKQCAVLEIHRSGLYYTPRPVIDEDLQLMRLMDLLHLEDPAKGTRMLAKDLADHGFAVGRARVRRLMRLMRIKAVYCMPRTTVIDAAKYKHPLPAARLEDRAAQPGVGRGHHLPAGEGRLHVHGRGDRRAYPLPAQLEHLQHHGSRVGHGHDQRSDRHAR